MVVKELRQGLRRRYFVTLFLVSQIFLLFTLSAHITAIQRGDDEVWVASSIFWVFLAVSLGVLIPFSGFHALADEKKAMTLELLQMTNLSSRGIVWGKWLSLAAQILLLISAIFPWVVLRYLLGGVNLAFDLALLGLLTIFGLTQVACSVGLSSLSSLFLRISSVVVWVLILLSVAWISLVVSVWPVSGARPDVFDLLNWGVGEWLMIVLQCVAVVFLALEYGASQIAPPAETHSFAIRLLSWLCVLPGVVGFLMKRETAVFYIVPSFFLLWIVCAGAVVERFSTAPGSYSGLARWGWLGRGLGLLFYPGWPSGVLFATISALLVICFFVVVGLMSLDAVFLVVLMIGSLLVPAAMAQMLPYATKTRFTIGQLFYLIIAICFAIGLFATLLPMGIGEIITHLFCFLPPTILFRWLVGKINGSEIEFFLAANLIATGVAFFVLVFLSLPRWRDIRRIEGGLKEER